MTRTSSVSRRLIGDTIEVSVSSRQPLVENGHDHMHTLSSVDASVSLRIKPDRRSIETVMPQGQDRRRF
jgi:hypothetical protein